jgi:hypothetical protein
MEMGESAFKLRRFCGGNTSKRHSVQRSAEEREDLLVPLSDIEPVVGEGGKFAFEIAGKQYKPTEWALGQFSGRLKLPSSTVIRELLNQDDSDWEDSDVAVRIAKNAIRRADKDKKYRVRAYSDGTLRAFVTDKYAPIDNRWYLETMNEHLPGSMYSHWRGDDDTIYGNLLLPDSIIDYGQSDDSDYGGMLSVGNCEIGKRRISQKPSLFRSICMNGNIWGKTEGDMIDRRHIGKVDLVDLKKRIVDNIEKQLPLIPIGVRKFLSLQTFKVEGSMKQILGAVCIRNKLDKTESREVLTQFATFEKDDRNLFGIVNSITRAGQNLSNEGWVKFDELGGQLTSYTESDWDRLNAYSRTITSEQIDEVFATAG